MKPHARFARRCGRYYVFAVDRGTHVRYTMCSVSAFWGDR